MTWTTEYPTKPGVYWMRNYLRNLDPEWQRYEKVNIEPIIILINDDLTFNSIASETERKPDEIVSAEWYGPIDPPE